MIRMIVLMLSIVGAWLLPLIGMAINKNNERRVMMFSFVSISCAAIIPCIGMYIISDFVGELNWTGLMDTTPYMSVIYAILVAGSIILNVIAVMLVDKEETV